MKNSLEYKQGYQAYTDGRPYEDNPYRGQDSQQEFCDWSDGWIDAEENATE